MTSWGETVGVGDLTLIGAGAGASYSYGFSSFYSIAIEAYHKFNCSMKVSYLSSLMMGDEIVPSFNFSWAI